MNLSKLICNVTFLLLPFSVAASTTFKLMLNNKTNHQAFFFAGFVPTRGPLLKTDTTNNWTYTLEDSWAPFGLLSVDGTNYLCKKENGDYLILNPRNYKSTDILTITITSLNNGLLTCACDLDKVCDTALK